MHRGTVLVVVFFAVSTPALADAQDRKPLSLTVLLPDSEAKVTVDGLPIKGFGVKRNLKTLPKKDAKFLTLTTTWEPNGYTKIIRSRKIEVAFDKQIVVDLTEPDPKTPDRIEVIYVPTPQAAVDAMCKMANVGPNDVVYDLGCGDGRIVITAVNKFKAKRGVGVDINAKLLTQSVENAKKAGVADKVEFRKGDVLDIKDLSSATVVMLYMGEDINLRLRPILQATLKPGARIVSHSFSMGDWEPNRTQRVRTNDVDCELFLWNIDTNTKELASVEAEIYRNAVAGLEKSGGVVQVLGIRATLTGGQIDRTTLANLHAFPHLKTLRLQNVKIGDGALEAIAKVKNLRRLHLANVRLSAKDVQSILSLKDLESLAFPFCAIDDAALKSFAKMTQLRELDLTATSATDAGVEALASLVGLRELSLDGVKITDQSLAHLKKLVNLQSLSLTRTAVTDAGLVHLQNLTKLKTLNLRGTRTSSGAVKHLRQKLPKTIILHSPNLLLN